MNTRKKSSPTSAIDAAGRTLPRSIDSEESLLCSLINYGELLASVDDALHPDDFYDEANKSIFRAAAELHAKREPIGLVTLVETLRKSGTLDQAGGAARLASLSAQSVSPADFQYCANIIRQKSIARKIIRSTLEIQALAFDETQDVADVIEACEKDLTGIIAGAAASESIDMPQAIKQTLHKAAQIQADRAAGKRIAIPTGLHSLDTEFYGGWRDPDLIVIGARPSMGKTQHALAFARAAALCDTEVLFISAEMSAVQLVNRYLLEDERISLSNLRTGQLSQEEWRTIDLKAAELWNMKMHIADNHNIRQLASIKSEARRLHRKGKLELLIIDYLQLIATGIQFPGRHHEIGYITKELKSLAKELSVPVILLSQLSRAQKGDKGTEPQLSDLKESGEIENDADIVIFIHKPDYYDPRAVDSSGEPWTGRGKLIIAKSREGARNWSVIFHHDSRYKKIWSQGEKQIAPGKLHPVDFSEPKRRGDEEMPF